MQGRQFQNTRTQLGKRFLTENMVIYIRFDLKATFKPGLIELLKANCNINVTDKAFISENTFC